MHRALFNLSCSEIGVVVLYSFATKVKAVVLQGDPIHGRYGYIDR